MLSAHAESATAALPQSCHRHCCTKAKLPPPRCRHAAAVLLCRCYRTTAALLLPLLRCDRRFAVAALPPPPPLPPLLVSMYVDT
jgi:hypothetical protein